MTPAETVGCTSVRTRVRFGLAHFRLAHFSHVAETLVSIMRLFFGSNPLVRLILKVCLKLFVFVQVMTRLK